MSGGPETAAAFLEVFLAGARRSRSKPASSASLPSRPTHLDWLDRKDELRLAIEERAGFSPDALTGMEASLRFAGPETMETRISSLLSARHNRIFQRPNATCERGALTMYDRPQRPAFDRECA